MPRTLPGVDSLAADLLDALTSGFEPFVIDRLTARGLEPAEFGPAVAESSRSLRRELGALMEIPYSAQDSAPLEVVRRCLRPLTEALLEAGVEPPGRDTGQARVAPDDPFDLGPASAADLGEAALQASLAWGAAKAVDATRPLVVVVSANLMDIARFEAAASGAGYRLAVAEPGSTVADAVVAFVDLESAGADEAISSLAEAGVKVVGYGPHLDDMAMVRARTLGAGVAEPRSRVLKNPAVFLPPLV